MFLSAAHTGYSCEVILPNAPRSGKSCTTHLSAFGMMPSQNGCRMVVSVLRLGIHPEMERPAILNRSMPSIAGATMSDPPYAEVRLSSTFQQFDKLSMRNTIYTFSEKYT